MRYCPPVTRLPVNVNSLLVVSRGCQAVTLTVANMPYSMQCLSNPPGILGLVTEFQSLPGDFDPF